MADVTIRVNPNGPYLIQGGGQVVDAAGKAFPTDPAKPFALCRCGASGNKPFCDGSHRASGFQAEEAAP